MPNREARPLVDQLFLNAGEPMKTTETDASFFAAVATAVREWYHGMTTPSELDEYCNRE